MRRSWLADCGLVAGSGAAEGAGAGAEAAAGAVSGLSLVLSFLASAGATTAADRSRMVAVFLNVIGRVSHAMGTSHRPKGRFGPACRVMYTGVSAPSNRPQARAL